MIRFRFGQHGDVRGSGRYAKPPTSFRSLAALITSRARGERSLRSCSVSRQPKRARWHKQRCASTAQATCSPFACKLGQRAKCDPIPGSGQKAIRESSFGGDNEFKNGSREGKQSFYLSSTRRAPGAANNGAAAVSEAHRESFKSKMARKGRKEGGVDDTNSFIYSRAFFSRLSQSLFVAVATTQLFFLVLICRRIRYYTLRTQVSSPAHSFFSPAFPTSAAGHVLLLPATAPAAALLQQRRGVSLSL